MSEASHLLSFVTNDDGSMVTIHADLAGVNLLIAELVRLRDQLNLDECPHTHLHSFEEADGQLSTAKLRDQPTEIHSVHHVKIYGWNREWKHRHGLMETR